MLFLSNRPELPLRPVTREEFLRVHAAFWKGKLEEAARNAEEAVARHPQELARFRRMASESDADFETRRRSFLNGQQAELKRRDEARARLQQIPARIQAQLDAMTPAERARPAVIGPLDLYSYQDIRFTEGGNARPLLTLNTAYHQPSPGRAAAHYLTVFCRRVPGSSPKEAALNELLSALDFNALRALLDR